MPRSQRRKWGLADAATHEPPGGRASGRWLFWMPNAAPGVFRRSLGHTQNHPPQAEAESHGAREGVQGGVFTTTPRTPAGSEMQARQARCRSARLGASQGPPPASPPHASPGGRASAGQLARKTDTRWPGSADHVGTREKRSRSREARVGTAGPVEPGTGCHLQHRPWAAGTEGTCWGGTYKPKLLLSSLESPE